MKSCVYVLVAVACLIACSRSSNDQVIDPDGPDGLKNVTALLNDSTWYAQGNASKEVAISGDSCSQNRVNLYFRNELPYPKGARKASPTDCVGPCNTTQYLSFRKVPLAVGTYDAANLTTCSPSPIYGVSYGLLVGGDAIFATYSTPSSNSGRIEITRVDPVARTIEGKFDLTLALVFGQSGQSPTTLRFRNGHFIVRLSQ
ncbi:hypothetical protein GCM10028805_39630 [Spirosoma harenae]